MNLRTKRRLALWIAAAFAPVVSAAPDGQLDPTFGQGGRQTVAFDLGPNNRNIATSLALLPDGRIMLAGLVIIDNQTINIGLARLMPDGQLDESFGRTSFLPTGAGAVAPVDVSVQPDGKLLVAGFVFLENQFGQRGLVCRFLADGAPDLAFAPALPNPLAGTGCRAVLPENDGLLTAVVVQADGHIVLGGDTDIDGVSHGLVVRLDAQGNFDTSFDSDGMHALLPESLNSTFLRDIALTPDGDLVAAGTVTISGTENDNWQVFRLRGEDGALDTDFDGDGIKPIAIDLIANGNDWLASVAVLPNGTIVIGGTAGVNDQNRCLAAARLKPDGQFDPSMNGDGLFVDTNLCLSGFNINDLLVQTDGRIVLAGVYSNGDNGDDFFAARILPQGGLDASFGGFGVMNVDFSSHYGVSASRDLAFQIASHGGRLLLVGGNGQLSDPSPSDFAIARLDNDLIFTDDLE